MKTSLFVLLGLLLFGLAWLRLEPIDRDRWHTDPAEADDPGTTGIRLIGLEAPRFPGDPETVLEALSDIVRDEPRARFLEGDIDEGMITFVARTKFLGIPDFITVKAVAEGDMTKLAVNSRSRFGFGSDWGVNAGRLDRWFQDMRLRLGQG